MKFIPFIEKGKADDYSTATSMARNLAEVYKINAGKPCFELKDTVRGLGEALAEEDIVVIGVTLKEFHKLKKALSVVLKMPLVEDAAVAEMTEQIQNRTVSPYHAQFLEGCRVFPSENGLFSGYGMSKGDQKVIVLPLNSMIVLPMLWQMQTFLLEAKEEKIDEYAEAMIQKEKTRYFSGLFCILSMLAVIACLTVGILDILL